MSIDKVSKAKQQTTMEAQENVKSKSTFREYAEAIIMALVLALFIRTFIVQAFKIPSGSMIPTLQIGDHILVNKLKYGLRVPDSILGIKIPGLRSGRYLCQLESVQHGDVVVLISPVDPSVDLIKRVIGIAGDAVMV